MSNIDNFIADFQAEHTQLMRLIVSLRVAIESLDYKKAKATLNVIDTITDGHFQFEEVYLYPRLRRLIFEITEALRNEQQKMKDFFKELKIVLNKNRLNKGKVNSILGVFPGLSKVLQDCNNLVFLIKKFTDKDQDLQQRFKELSKAKNKVSV